MSSTQPQPYPPDASHAPSSRRPIPLEAAARFRSRVKVFVLGQPVIAARVTPLLPLLLAGCISYTVGQGAETTPQGERAVSSSLNLVPGTLSNSDSSASTRRPSVDTDIRFGVDDRTDVGFRIATYSGFMLTWKRQLSAPDSSKFLENRARTSIMLGGGLVNAGEHAALEATLISSSKWSAAGQWYGAVRAIQVFPITNSARSDDPVIGLSVGHLFGDRNKSMGPELGVYYDRSTLGLNTNRILVIPSFVVRGQSLPWIGRQRAGRGR